MTGNDEARALLRQLVDAAHGYMGANCDDEAVRNLDVAMDAADAFLATPAAPAAPAEPVAEWRMVPAEPTPTMLAAGVAAASNASTHVQERLTLYAYRAMLNAAPPPPSAEAEDAARWRFVRTHPIWMGFTHRMTPEEMDAELDHAIRKDAARRAQEAKG